MRTSIRIFLSASFILTAALTAAAQDVPPSPGFSPSAPRSAASDEQPASAPEEAFPNSTDPYTSPPPASPYTSSPGTASPPYSAGGFVPQSQPMDMSDVYLPRFWIRAEALYWWIKDSPVPVPVITKGGFKDAIPGAIGQPGTSVLLGNQDIGFSGRGGGRFTLGWAVDSEALWGVEGTYFFLANATASRGVSSDGSPNSALLALPFFNPVAGHEDATFIALPGSFAGSAVLSMESFVQGAEGNVLHNLSNAVGWQWDGLFGFRYLNLQERLTLTTSSPNVAPNLPDTFTTFDRFSTQNNFYGGQVGLRATYDNPYLFFNGTAKVAVGSTVEDVSTSGALLSSGSTVPGAYFTQPTNLGSTSRGQFAVVPGLDLNFGIRLTPWTTITVGYSFLYVSSVARPGDQIDRVINPSQAPAISGHFPGHLVGPARPALGVHDSDFWVQGLTFALDLRY